MTDNELPLKLWVVLARAYQALRRHAAADLERHGLSEGEFAVLEALYHKGPMLLVEVQRKILVSSGGITYLVDRLAEKGLAERRPCATDRRASYAALTKEGERLIRTIFPAHEQAIARAVSGLSDAEKRQAVKLVRKLGLSAAELTAPGEPEPAPQRGSESGSTRQASGAR